MLLSKNQTYWNSQKWFKKYNRAHGAAVVPFGVSSFKYIPYFCDEGKKIAMCYHV